MHETPRPSSGKLAGLAGVLTGVATGLAAAVVAGAAIAQQFGDHALGPLLEATHLPPLLTPPGEQVELRYDVYCTPPSAEQIDEPCDAAGAVFARAGESGPFRELPLVRSDGGGLVARVPDDLSRSPTGLSYYAVIRSERADRTVTLPGGGAAAPQRSLPLQRATVVRLGRHAFGRVRTASERVAEAAWGAGPGQVGLEQGRNLSPIGGSSFDVDEAGTIHVLDQANRRLLRWERGTDAPAHVPLAVDGTLADLEVGEDESIAVLETAPQGERGQVVRLFDRHGTARGTVRLAERGSALRTGPAGPVVLEHPSGQWMPAAIGGRAVSPAEQRRSGTAGRPLRDGAEVVLLRLGNELRVAHVARGGARRAWLLSSETSLAEVQLAEPMGRRLVVVVRAYTDERSEFLVLVLDDRGIAARFAAPAADWAETAPLSRFRLVGASLYQLGSTPAGLFVDRFDLEVS